MLIYFVIYYIVESKEPGIQLEPFMTTEWTYCYITTGCPYMGVWLGSILLLDVYADKPNL